MTWLLLWLTLMLPPSAPLYGVGVPAQITPPESFSWDMAWYNWDDDACNGDANYWAMTWRPVAGKQLPAECANAHLLVGNECEEQCNQTPAEVAAYLATLDGRLQVWCCGSLYDWQGLTYTLAVIGHYIAMHGEPPTLLGLHMHVYSYGAVDEQMLRLWRDIASHFGWHITVSEYACLDYRHSAVKVAQCLPVLTKTLERTLQPYAMFWFSYAYGDHAPLYAQTDLVDNNGELTPVGVAWWQMVDAAATDIGDAVQWWLYAPVVKNVWHIEKGD